jgi:predicted LPLAT superfamily acyltransferase
MSEPGIAARSSSNWLSIPERGSVLGIRFMVWAVGIGGRTFARAVLWFVMVYFFAFSARARRASRNFLARLEQPHRTSDVFGHLLRFGQVALDRVLLVQGKTSSFEFDNRPRELFEELQRAEKGALLLGAHVGSFEALAGMARHFELSVGAVVNTGGSKMLTEVLQHLNPELAANLIDLDKGRLDAIFEIRRRLENGQHIGVLADRVVAAEKFVVVPFLGQDARFPAGPFILAASMGCRVYFVAALYRGGNRYEVYAQRLTDRVVLPRQDREAGLRKYAGLYSEHLERLVRAAPTNWFNFFDFWDLGE